MKAVVLAGGLGTRLYPLTKITPKPMIPLAGKPILEYITEWLRKHGVKDVIIVARYLGDQILAYFKDHPYVRAMLLDSKDTADAIRLLDGILEESFIVTMGDTLCNIVYREIYESHESSNAVATIALKQVENPLPYGIVYLNEQGDIQLFIEKPLSIEVYLLNIAYYRRKSLSAYENLINTGIYVLSQHILEILEKNPGLLDFGRHVFPYLIENEYKVKGYILKHNVYWNDVGRLETYRNVAWDLLDGEIAGFEPGAPKISPGIYMHESSLVKGEVHPPVYIGRNVVIEDDTVIGPYVILEDNVKVEHGSIIRESIIWHNTIIRRGSKIYDTIIMNNVEVAENTRMMASVIGTGNHVRGDISKKNIEPVEVTPPYA
ncbi:NDP-sugar synthase [Desulfurococcus amylolyticus]|uniref:NDP-sugar synthase n=1 Tax=Desulfurococcus amylolyticus TaxID=94694 RepID=UPI0023F0CEB9|nr:NDP-sugar synthase [Desulfurococcus amylolyticus]